MSSFRELRPKLEFGQNSVFSGDAVCVISSVYVGPTSIHVRLVRSREASRGRTVAYFHSSNKRQQHVVDKPMPVITSHSLRGDVYSFASYFAGQSELFESQISVKERFKRDQRCVVN